MSPAQYQLVAGTLKYWFVLVIIIIFVRTLRNAWSEYRVEKQHNPPQALVRGYVAHMEAWKDGAQWLPIGEETLVGSKRSCDVRIADAGLRPSHARLFFDGGRLFVERLCGGDNVLRVGGKNVEKILPVPDGAKLRLGEATLVVSVDVER
nr:FHA domain-containing protein [Maliibacterium massiliense]